jgi:hypothetical protein
MSGLNTEQTFTATLTNDIFVFNEDSGITTLQVTLISGACTVLGTRIANNIPSSPVAMRLNCPITIFVNDIRLPHDVTFDFSSGTVQMIGK